VARHSKKDVGTGGRARLSERLPIKNIDVLRATDRSDSQYYKEIARILSYRMDDGYYELRLTSVDAEKLVKDLAKACDSDETRRKMAEQILPFLSDFAFLQAFQAALKNRKLKQTQDGLLTTRGELWQSNGSS
jgi:hypothetical protein